MILGYILDNDKFGALQAHLGHSIEMCSYGKGTELGQPAQITVECRSCNHLVLGAFNVVKTEMSRSQAEELGRDHYGMYKQGHLKGTSIAGHFSWAEFIDNFSPNYDWHHASVSDCYAAYTAGFRGARDKATQGQLSLWALRDVDKKADTGTAFYYQRDGTIVSWTHLTIDDLYTDEDKTKFHNEFGLPFGTEWQTYRDARDEYERIHNSLSKCDRCERTINPDETVNAMGQGKHNILCPTCIDELGQCQECDHQFTEDDHDEGDVFMQKTGGAICLTCKDEGLWDDGQSGRKCECEDNNCPVHEGQSHCKAKSIGRFFRVDMQDESGTEFCEPCYNDALSSGVYESTSED